MKKLLFFPFMAAFCFPLFADPPDFQEVQKEKIEITANHSTDLDFVAVAPSIDAQLYAAEFPPGSLTAIDYTYPKKVSNKTATLQGYDYTDAKGKINSTTIKETVKSHSADFKVGWQA